MLSSFINRRKVKKISLFDAALRRAPSSPSLEIQSDHENSRSKHWASLSKARASKVSSIRPSALHRQSSSPKVHLDFTPSSSNDWFPQEILASYDEDGHLPFQPIPESSTSSSHEDVMVIGPERVSFILFFPRLAYPNPPQAETQPRTPSAARFLPNRARTRCMLTPVSR